jgi:FAD/FMN-containing dehydrogenase
LRDDDSAEENAMAASIVDLLRESISGEVFGPSDPGYEAARAIYNSMIETRPQAVARPRDAAEVAQALRLARDAGLPISVRGGGHGVAGTALCEGVVIDLSAMRQVTVDPGARTATVGGGGTWVDIDSATQAHNLATPGGRVTHTGIGGLTLGGGQGWLSPKHGLSCDNLIGAEVVTADGRIVNVSAHENPDLFWGLRGAGGNFAAVTAFTFALHPVGPVFMGGLLIHPLERAVEVAAMYQDFVANNPEFGGAMVFLSAPPAPGVPEEAVGAPVVAIAAAWFDSDLSAGERALKPLREFGPPLVDMVGPMPYLALQSMTDAGNAPGFRNHWSASYIDSVPATLIEDTIAAAAAKKSVLSHVIVAQMGAAAHEIDEQATAFPNRGAQWLFHPIAAWSDPADDAVNRDWARGLNAKATQFASRGTYLNVDADADEARVRWTYGEEKYNRLVALKQAWDPDNVFRQHARIATSTDLGAGLVPDPRPTMNGRTASADTGDPR